MKNCWELLNCTHTRVAKNGDSNMCPAYKENMGHSCWILAGTFCKEAHLEADKPKNHDYCTDCIAYQQYNRTSGPGRGKIKEEYPEEYSEYNKIMLKQYDKKHT